MDSPNPTNGNDHGYPCSSPRSELSGEQRMDDTRPEGAPVPERPNALEWGAGIAQGLLLAALLWQPAWRTPLLLAPFWILTLGIELRYLKLGWRSGLLKQSLPGIYGSFRSGGPQARAQRERSALSLLHGLALVSGVIWML
jgi:hypothetical protein